MTAGRSLRHNVATDALPGKKSRGLRPQTVIRPAEDADSVEPIVPDPTPLPDLRTFSIPAPVVPTIEELWRLIEMRVNSPPSHYDGDGRILARLLLDLRMRLTLHECKNVPVIAHRSGFPPAVRTGSTETEIDEASEWMDRFVEGVIRNTSKPE